MARNLKTGWVVLATSGSVVHGAEDGRTIEKQWLTDMAENYNTKVFTAKIWPDHRRYNSGGSVLALKTQPATESQLEGEIQLLGILAPNDWLIYANKAGDYTHPSIEVGENYLGKGKFFLKGLGVTDEPASAGVSELSFSTKDGTEKAKVFSGQQFNLADHLEEERSIFQRIFSRDPQSEYPSNPEQDGEAMKPEQLEELKNFMKTEIQTGIDQVRQDFKQQQNSPEGGDGSEGGDGREGGEPEAVSAEQFNQVKSQLEDLTEKFNKALKTPAGGTEVPEGQGGAETEII